MCFPSSEDHQDLLNMGSALSRHGLNQAALGCGCRRGKAATPYASPTCPQAPPLHLHCTQHPAGMFSSCMPHPSSRLGTASDPQCLPHPADTGHAGPRAVSQLLIIGKVGAQPGCRRRDLGSTVAMPWRTSHLHCGCAGGDPSGQPLLNGNSIWEWEHVPSQSFSLSWHTGQPPSAPHPSLSPAPPSIPALPPLGCLC